MNYPKYLVAGTAVFQPQQFPKIITEMDDIRSFIDLNEQEFSPDMFLSYVKDHSMETTCADNNHPLAKMIGGNQLNTENIEALFDCCKENNRFRDQLERYIRDRCRI